jgi:formylglycine-generating enzyme required for sulfatase activity
MKFRILTLLLLLTMLMGLAACSGTSVPGPGAADTTDSAGVTLVPYTSAEFGIRGVVPEGWAELKPGQFHRSVRGSDLVFLGQVAFPGATMEQVVGTMGLPEPVGSMTTADLTWDLHTVEVEWGEAGTIVGDIALAEGDDGVYFVMLVALAEEHEALHDAVFLAAVDALAPEAAAEVRPTATPAAPPAGAPVPIDTRVRSTDGMVMVHVPAGEFQMGNTGIQWIWGGSLRDGDLGVQVFTDEQPGHTVYLDAFWIDQTEVTVAMFRTFVEATGYETTAEREGWGHPWTQGPMEEEWPQVPGTDWQHPRGPESSAEDDHPVVQVSWEDAAAYCEWAGGQLPTEAQWEKAARGTDGRMWPWGNTYDGALGSFCDAQCPIERWKQDYFDDGYAFTAPVGTFPSGASPYGALDMAGNVWEWVADWYEEDYYVDSASQNPLGPDSGTDRAMRGGAWYDNEPWVRCTVRHQNPPWSRCDDVGFRCAVPAQEGSP